MYCHFISLASLLLSNGSSNQKKITCWCSSYTQFKGMNFMNFCTIVFLFIYYFFQEPTAIPSRKINEVGVCHIGWCVDIDFAAHFTIHAIKIGFKKDCILP